MTDSYPRRSVLTTLGTAIALLSGCGESESQRSPTGSESAAETASPADPEVTDEGPIGGTETTPTPKLDLREANVVDVTVEGDGGDQYRFDVTLYHDDAGEDDYANWWQVEALDGTRLGRRELLHAHGTQAFTRSERIDVPSEHSCVVVRGHDQTHDYGGQATIVNVDSGATRTVRQGSEKTSFVGESCP